MNRKKIITTGIFSFAVFWGGMHFLPSATAQNVPKSEPKPVAVVRVTHETLNRSITLSAEFRSFQEADLRARVAGYLKKINVDIGDEVHVGKIVATLDTDELKADLDRASAGFRDARLDYERINSVNKKRPGLLAQDEVDKAQAAYEMAKANMERAKILLEYAIITMPFDGIVTKRYVDAGALVQASSSGTPALPVVHVADNTRLRLFFPVPESAVPKIQVGTPVELTVQATGQTMNAVIARRSGAIDSATRTMEAEVDVENTDRRIMPGMYASVTINLDHKENALCLPVQAVAGNDRPTVWRVNEQNQLEERPVQLGLQTADRVEIISGLNAGDNVVFGSRGALSVGVTIDPKPIANKKGS